MRRLGGMRRAFCLRPRLPGRVLALSLGTHGPWLSRSLSPQPQPGLRVQADLGGEPRGGRKEPGAQRGPRRLWRRQLH